MEILHYLQNFLITHWTIILAYLGAGGGVSVVLQFVKKLRKWDSVAWVEFVLGLMTSLTSAADYVINNYTTSPLPTIFGNFAPKILVAALIMHRLLVSPLSKLIESKLLPWVTELRMAVAQLKLEKASSVATPDISSTSFES